MNTMKPKDYTVDYFIRKFEALKDEDVGSNDIKNHCALWHCGVDKHYSATPEAVALSDLFRPLIDIPTENLEPIYFVNDGTCGGFENLPPRQRILAALREVKEMGEK